MNIIYRLTAIVLAVLIVDGASKIWSERALTLHQPVPLGGETFRLTLGYNTGVAFGMFANGGIWPLLITGLIIVGLIGWFTRGLYSGHLPAHAVWAVGLLLGGAIGNFIDRLPDNRVTDFIDVGLGATRWPTFNLADSFILIGVGLLMLHSFAAEDQSDQALVEPPPPEGDPNGLLRDGQ